MGDYRRSASPYGVSGADSVNSHLAALVASSRLLTGLGDPLIIKREWQKEAWDFYHAMGEYWYGVTWKASAMSRVRLVAAKLSPGGDEPEILRDDQVDDPGEGTSTGPNAETTLPKSKLTDQDRQVVQIVERFGGGIGGQARIMKSLTVQLTVPGEGFVIGEQKPLDDSGIELTEPEWSVKSGDEIRRKDRGNTKKSPTRLLARIGPGVARPESQYEVRVEENSWVPLSGESIICRVWNPDDQFHWRALSASLAALPILREIDLYNRRIIADLISRLASNGLLIIPQEATFPVNPEFKDAPDPFVAELIDIASKGIKNPGSASAAIPIPIKVPSALVDKFVHLTFAAAFEVGILDARDRAIKRLATTLDMPEEVLTGVTNVNHWTAWQIDESGIKIHIAPTAEIIVDALTKGYLSPTMEVLNIPPVAADGSRYVIWYDVSELTAKPDLGDAADAAHADGSISDAAYRREKGFSESDAPDEEQLQKQIMRFLAFQGNTQAITTLFPALTEAMTPPPPPGYGPDGRPLAPEAQTVTETTQMTDTTPAAKGPPSTPKKPVTTSAPVGG